MGPPTQHVSEVGPNEEPFFSFPRFIHASSCSSLRMLILHNVSIDRWNRTPKSACFLAFLRSIKRERDRAREPWSESTRRCPAWRSHRCGKRRRTPLPMTPHPGVHPHLSSAGRGTVESRRFLSISWTLSWKGLFFASCSASFGCASLDLVVVPWWWSGMSVWLIWILMLARRSSLLRDASRCSSLTIRSQVCLLVNCEVIHGDSWSVWLINFTSDWASSVCRFVHSVFEDTREVRYFDVNANLC